MPTMNITVDQRETHSFEYAVGLSSESSVALRCVVETKGGVLFVKNNPDNGGSNDEIEVSTVESNKVAEVKFTGLETEALGYGYDSRYKLFKYNFTTKQYDLILEGEITVNPPTPAEGEFRMTPFDVAKANVTKSELENLYSDKKLQSPMVVTDDGHLLYQKDDYSFEDYSNTATSEIVKGYVATGWGEPKGGLLFDGVNDYINILDNVNLDFGDALGNDKPFSLEFFGYIQSGTTDRGIISKGNVTAREYALNIYSTNRIALALYSANSANRLSVYYPTALVSGWYHIVGTYDGSKTNSGLKLYLNGIPLTVANDNAGTYAGNDVNSGTISIGRWFSNGSGYYSGKAIIARIWNRVLSASEILSLYNNGLQGQNALPFADVGANNTDFMINGSCNANVTGWAKFSGTLSWNGDSGQSALGTTGYAQCDVSSELHNYIYSPPFQIKYGKRYRGTIYLKTSNTNNLFASAVIQISTPASTNLQPVTMIEGANNIQTLTTDWQKFVFEFTANQDNNNMVFYCRVIKTVNDTFTFMADEASIIPIGCVAEYLPENSGDYSWYDSSGNRLHGEVVSTAGAGGASPLFRQLIQKATTGNFTTNIASGVASKVIYCPPGYSINSIAVRNTLASGNITDFQAVMAGVNLVTGKTINNAKSVIFKSIADHEISSSPQAITFTATGNGTGGIEISVAFFRRD